MKQYSAVVLPTSQKIMEDPVPIWLDLEVVLPPNKRRTKARDIGVHVKIFTGGRQEKDPIWSENF